MTASSANAREFFHGGFEDRLAMLSAYLDHELPAGDEEQLEEALVGDPRLRQEFTQLKQAWELLDHLPATEVDRGFTRTTVEMAAVTAEEEAAASRGRAGRVWLARGGLFLAAVALCAGFGWLGYDLTAHRLSAEDRRLAEESPYIGVYELYRHVPSVTFLREVAATQRLPAAAEQETPRTVVPFDPFAPPPSAQRIAAIAEMPVPARARLAQAAERFAGLPAAQRNRTIRLHEELLARPDADELLETLLAYHEWVTSLSAAERAEFLSLPEQKRPAALAAIIQQHEAKRLREATPLELSDNDVQAIFRWLADYTQRHERELIATLPEGVRARLASIPEGRGRRWAVLRALQSEHAGHRLPRPDGEDMAVLVQSLSPPLRATLAAAETSAAKQDLLKQWLRSAVLSRGGFGPSREALAHFYAQRLTDEERRRLKELPPEQLRTELTRLFFRDQFHGGGEPRGAPRRGPGGGVRRPTAPPPRRPG